VSHDPSITQIVDEVIAMGPVHGTTNVKLHAATQD